MLTFAPADDVGTRYVSPFAFAFDLEAAHIPSIRLKLV